MELPEIGSTITTREALRLCEHYRLDYLVKRLTNSPDLFKSWEFDGCSCLADKSLDFFTGCKWERITYRCCLPHDLCYAYGEPGNTIERKRVDLKFYSDLVTKAGMQEMLAYAFMAAVRIGGVEEFGLSFSWGFAHKEKVDMPKRPPIFWL